MRYSDEGLELANASLCGWSTAIIKLWTTSKEATEETRGSSSCLAFLQTVLLELRFLRHDLLDLLKLFSVELSVVLFARLFRIRLSVPTERFKDFLRRELNFFPIVQTIVLGIFWVTDICLESFISFSGGLCNISVSLL